MSHPLASRITKIPVRTPLVASCAAVALSEQWPECLATYVVDARGRASLLTDAPEWAARSLVDTLSGGAA